MVFVVWCVMCDVWCVVCVFFLPQGHLTVALGVLFLYSKGRPTMALGVLFPLPRVSPHGGPRGAFSLSRGSPTMTLGVLFLHVLLEKNGCGHQSQCTPWQDVPLTPTWDSAAADFYPSVRAR